MHVLGIDLAASPASTGVVTLRRTDGDRWRAEMIDRPADDDLLVELARGAIAVGVDAPLGWPDAFVAAVAAQHQFDRWPAGTDRSPLTHRETDRFTKQFTGRLPLSASADLLGVVAMRCALLQRRWADEVWGSAAPRDGSGVLSETYPSAAFAVWDIEAKGYKARRDAKAAAVVRERIVEELSAATGSWLDLGDVAAGAVRSDHVLDALVCGLIAIAAGDANTHRPAPELVEVARREGWIHVPSVPLDSLRPPA